MPETRATLPPAQRRRFATGSLALDFVHTGGAGLSDTAELLHTREDLQMWLGLILERDVTARDKDLEPARALREALWRVSRRHLAGRPYRPRDVEVVNAAAGPLPIDQLDVTGTLGKTALTAREALGAIAADAVQRFSDPHRKRVRECAADGCQLLFYDASRPGRRQWCSMERCGNLTKTRGYRSRGARHIDGATGGQ